MLRRRDRVWPRPVVVEPFVNTLRSSAEPVRAMTARLSKNAIWLILFGLFGQLLISQTAAAKPESAIPARQAPTKVANFSLRDHEVKNRELYQQADARAVVLIFTSTGCPIVQKSVPKIKALRDQFGSKGVVFWLINSTPQDDAQG